MFLLICLSFVPMIRFVYNMALRKESNMKKYKQDKPNCKFAFSQKTIERGTLGKTGELLVIKDTSRSGKKDFNLDGLVGQRTRTTCYLEKDPVRCEARLISSAKGKGSNNVSQQDEARYSKSVKKMKAHQKEIITQLDLNRLRYAVKTSQNSFFWRQIFIRRRSFLPRGALYCLMVDIYIWRFISSTQNIRCHSDSCQDHVLMDPAVTLILKESLKDDIVCFAPKPVLDRAFCLPISSKYSRESILTDLNFSRSRNLKKNESSCEEASDGGTFSHVSAPAGGRLFQELLATQAKYPSKLCLRRSVGRASLQSSRREFSVRKGSLCEQSFDLSLYRESCFPSANFDQILEILSSDPNSSERSKMGSIWILKNNLKEADSLKFSFESMGHEVIRILLEIIFESQYYSLNHGFRPGKSVHTCLKQIQKDFKESNCFLVGDLDCKLDQAEESSVRKNKGIFRYSCNRPLDSFRSFLLWNVGSNNCHFPFNKYSNKVRSTGLFKDKVAVRQLSKQAKGRESEIRAVLSEISLHELDNFLVRLKRTVERKNLTLRNTKKSFQRCKIEKVSCLYGAASQKEGLKNFNGTFKVRRILGPSLSTKFLKFIIQGASDPDISKKSKKVRTGIMSRFHELHLFDSCGYLGTLPSSIGSSYFQEFRRRHLVKSKIVVFGPKLKIPFLSIASFVKRQDDSKRNQLLGRALLSIYYVRFFNYFLIGLRGQQQKGYKISQLVARYLEIRQQLKLKKDAIFFESGSRSLRANKQSLRRKIPFLGYLLDIRSVWKESQVSFASFASSLVLRTLASEARSPNRGLLRLRSHRRRHRLLFAKQAPGGPLGELILSQSAAHLRLLNASL
ncbi:hypothetical protein CLOM_g19200 [Closterium sp. NIES-68]|nr:hypothetical protein CLOM_g19200 [Closterium sp. NIES-68]